MYNVMLVVNVDGAELGASETFIESHISSINAYVFPVIGNPCYRICRINGHPLLNSSFLGKSMRWAARKLKLSTAQRQDTKGLTHFIKANKINAVIAEYGVTAITVMHACNKMRIPLIAHFHGYDAYRYDILEKYGDQYRELFRIAKKIIAVSTHMQEHLRTLGAPHDKLFLNSCGADIDNIEHVDFSKRVHRQFVMVGRLTPKKGQIYTINAFAEILDTYPDAKLLIIGDGEQMRTCISLIAQLNLSDSIFLLGAKPHSECLEFIARSFCFLQHSIVADNGDREGTPVAVLEAMCLGTPVIATRHGGIVDVIQAGRNGLLVEEKDTKGMRDAMLHLLGDEKMAERLGQEARKTSTRRWAMKIKNQRLSELVVGSINSTDTSLLDNS